MGLDVNHAKGSSLAAPIDFDTQADFNSLKMGRNKIVGVVFGAGPMATFRVRQGWLNVTMAGRGDRQALQVSADASGLDPGGYSADIAGTCGATTDSMQEQVFHVRLRVPSESPQ